MHAPPSLTAVNDETPELAQVRIRSRLLRRGAGDGARVGRVLDVVEVEDLRVHHDLSGEGGRGGG